MSHVTRVENSLWHMRTIFMNSFDPIELDSTTFRNKNEKLLKKFQSTSFSHSSLQRQFNKYFIKERHHVRY
jgi:hypothetical protein